MIWKSISRTFLVISFIGLSVSALSQQNTLRVEPTVSFNSVTMTDIKSIMSSVQSQFPFDLELIDDFPAYWGFGVEVTNQPDKDGFSYGGVLHYNSSGARLNISDYSGSIKYDAIVSRFVVGPTVRFIQPIGSKYEMGASMRLTASFSNLKFDYKVDISSFTESSVNRFSSISGQVGVNWINRFQVAEKIYLIGQVGYELDVVSGKLKFQSNSDAWLLTPGGDNARLDWSGLRIQLGVGFNLPLKNQ